MLEVEKWDEKAITLQQLLNSNSNVRDTKKQP
jgi:hypothetical protein